MRNQYIYIVYLYFVLLRKETNEIPRISLNRAAKTLSLEIHCVPAYIRNAAVQRGPPCPFFVCTKIYVCTHNVSSILWPTVCFERDTRHSDRWMAYDTLLRLITAYLSIRFSTKWILLIDWSNDSRLLKLRLTMEHGYICLTEFICNANVDHSRRVLSIWVCLKQTVSRASFHT